MADIVRTHHLMVKYPHEEADTPVCIHAKHAPIEGNKALIIVATDVVVIAASVMAALQELDLERLDHRTTTEFIFFMPSLDVTF